MSSSEATTESIAQSIRNWPVDQAAVGWISANGSTSIVGDLDQQFALASVTKPLFALAILVAVEEGSLSLDQLAGPKGATIAHLLSHSSGVGPEADQTADLPVLAHVGAKRIYSNLGYELLGDALEAATGLSPAQYFTEAVVNPLGLSATTLSGSPAHGAHSTLRDLLVVLSELFVPTLISDETLHMATSPFLEGLDGVLPGFGRQDPNLWGLGFEIRGQKAPHWTGTSNSTSTFGHFGRAGTFVWIDPERKIGCVGLSNRDFGPWAASAWPLLANDVLQVAK